MANLIFTSLGSGGDVLPFLRIAKNLQKGRHHVTLISHCHYEAAAFQAGIDFDPVDNIEDYAKFVEDEPLLNTPGGIPSFIRRHIFSKVIKEIELIRRRSQAGNTVLVVRDLFDTAARIAAEKFGIPFVVVFFAPSQVATWKLRIELFSHILGPEINSLRVQVGLKPVRDWTEWLGYPNRSIALWPDWFAAPTSTWPPGVVPVGFIIDNSADTIDHIPDEIHTFLTSGDRPILITCGTGMYIGTRFYSVSAKACELLKYRSMLFAQRQQQISHDVRDSFQWFGYVPFGRIMKDVKAVIHHGGRGTLSSAIAAGVPQFILATGADRPDNAARLKLLGVADYVLPTDWKPTTIATKLQKLTQSTAIRERCKELSLSMLATDSLSAACQIIKDSVGQMPGLRNH